MNKLKCCAPDMPLRTIGGGSWTFVPNRNPRFWGFSSFVPGEWNLGNKGLGFKTGTLRTVRSLTYCLQFSSTISPRTRGREVLLRKKLEKAGQKVRGSRGDDWGGGLIAPARVPSQRRKRAHW